mmetsp:Transcript_10175/g.15908  ORF Transcript_10175/g.15908 Transcript_10175/m.15908 type:complete len:108 (-) Transcript_10175:315-638(-)
MGRLTHDGFLIELDKNFSRVRNSGSLFITIKRYEPKPRKGGKPNPEGNEPLCLIRAKLGSNAISTVVAQKDVAKFHTSFEAIMKGNMDGLKKPEKEKKKKERKDEAK